jgi:starvation-inducible DNA-binding protein
MRSETVKSHPSASALSEEARGEAADALQSCLVDGIDLYSQLKVAHWNLKGPLYVRSRAPIAALARSLSPRACSYSNCTASRSWATWSRA